MSEAAVTLGFWPAVARLLRLQALILFNGLRRSSWRGRLGAVALAFLTLLIVAFVFAMSLALLNFLRSPQLVAAVPGASELLASVPVLVMGGSFLVILITSFGVLLQALYLSGDMDFLLSAPIPVRAVFVSKLLQAILPNLGLVSLGALPLLFGLGVSGGYSGLYYPLVIVMLAALALAAAAMASLLVMAAVRVFPARHVAEVLGFAGALVSIVCSQSGQFARGAGVNRQQVAGLLRLVTSLDVPWSPLAWAGRGLVGIGEGRWLAGVGFSLLALGTAGLAFGLALVGAERLYYSGWAAMQGAARRKKAARAARRRAGLPLAAAGGRLLPPAVGAIVAKDWAVLRRDLRNLSQLVTPLVLGIVYTLMLVRAGAIPTDGGHGPAWATQALQGAMGYAGIGISLFVGWTLLARLAAMGFSQEGKSYWLLKAAPVSAGQLLAAKFLAAYLPSLAVSAVFVAIMALVGRGDPAPTAAWFSFAVVALCLAAADGIYLWFGVTGARFDWQDPRQMVSGATGCLGALVTGLALGLALALFALPQIGLTLLGWPALAGELAGLVVGGAFCLACAVVPLRLVRERVPQLGEA